MSSSKPYSTIRDNGGTITVSPKMESQQSGLVVISHGLGDSAEGFADVAEQLASLMPHLKFILPTAPTQPVTMNMGMPMPSWYDIKGLDDRSNESCTGIEASQQTILNILQTEHESTGLPYNRMVLAGFSQGGALSLFTGMQLPSNMIQTGVQDGSSVNQQGGLAGIVVMSGYLPAASSFTIPNSLKNTPILHCHGEADPMVLLNMAFRSKQVVTEERGAMGYELKTYPGLPHSINVEVLQDVTTFLKQVLPANETCRVQLKDPSKMSIKELKATIQKAGLGRHAVGLMEKSEFVRLVQNHRDGKL